MVTKLTSVVTQYKEPPPINSHPLSIRCHVRSFNKLSTLYLHMQKIHEDLTYSDRLKAAWSFHHVTNLKYCTVLYCMYFLLVWRKPRSTYRSLIKTKQLIVIITKCIITYTILPIINVAKLTAGFFSLKALTFIKIFFVFVFGFWYYI